MVGDAEKYRFLVPFRYHSLQWIEYTGGNIVLRSLYRGQLR